MCLLLATICYFGLTTDLTGVGELENSTAAGCHSSPPNNFSASASVLLCGAIGQRH